MQTTTLIANPFAMMLDPERIAREVEHSERLNRLQRRICRPLDKPLIPKGVAELDAYDRMIEDTVVEPEELTDGLACEAGEAQAYDC